MKKLKALTLAFVLAISSVFVSACSTPPPAPQEITGVVFESATYTYDGLPKEIVATGLPEGVTVEYTNNVATNVGNYTAIATLTGNGYIEKILCADLVINPADFQGLSLNGKSVSYNNTNHSIAIEGDIPSGASVTYTYNNQAVDGVKEIGDYEVKATVSMPNYNPLTLTAILTITQGKYEGLSLTGKTVEYVDGQNFKLELEGEIPMGATALYYYNGVLNQGNLGVTSAGVYEVKVIVTNKASDPASAKYCSEYYATLTVQAPQMSAEYISVSDIMTSADLTNGEFYDHKHLTQDTVTADQGLTIGGKITQTSFGISLDGTNSWGMEYIGGSKNSVKVKTGSVAFQKNVVGTEYYVEAVFDATSTAYTLGNGFAGLLVAHATDWVLSANEPDATRLMVSIHGNNILSCVTYGWGYYSGKYYNGREALVQSNWTEFFTAQEVANMDKTAVKLGVLRYGDNNFAFFVNNRYVGSRNYGNINIANSGTASFGQSGIGISSAYRYSGTTNQDLANGGEIIKDFKYSTNAQLIDDLSAKVPAKSIDLYMIAGQSNAAGNAIFPNENAMLSLDEKSIYGNSAVIFRGNRSNYDWSVSRIGFGEGDNKIGAEVGMMNYFTKATIGEKLNTKYAYDANAGRYAGIIKTAVGGTGFDYYTADGGTWLKNNGWWGSPSIKATVTNQYSTPVRNLYDELVNNVVGAVDNLQKAGFTTIRIKGLFWMQGERHIGSAGPTPSTNDQYYKWFTAFATDLRNELNTKIGAKIGQNLTGMKILIGEVSETFGMTIGWSETDFNNKVVQNKEFILLQNYIAQNFAGVEILNTQAFPLNKIVNGKSTNVGSDTSHWNYNQMFEIGKLVGEKMFAF